MERTDEPRPNAPTLEPRPDGRSEGRADGRGGLRSERREGALTLVCTDPLGETATVTVPATVVADGGGLAPLGGPLSGGLVAGLRLRPDLRTLHVLPACGGAEPVARVICDLIGPDGGLSPLGPRRLLRGTLDALRATATATRVRSTIQFHLLDGPGMADPQASEAARTLIVAAAEAARLPVIAASEDAGRPGLRRCSVSLGPLPPVDAADAVMTLRAIIRRAVAAAGCRATFMPIPANDATPARLVLTLLLSRNKRGLFGDAGVPTAAAEAFAAGVGEHAAGLAAIVRPTVNSYTPSSAPSAGLRSVSEGGLVWLSFADADSAASPYLALAGILAAGIDALTTSEAPPANDAAPSAVAVAAVSDSALAPTNLAAAARALAADGLLHGALGSEWIDIYVAAKLAEAATFARVVHPWEIARYTNRL